ncbi:hypothetical protein JCM17846_18670 [Iodidimonas nitroreducens]|uniref:Uncharacterized protein n=2 Tax=Iodidimonas nitroreducens TaxID=1236968 RepID=A0A5A7N995_9PROT|nr:hypothetical protein JCM17846_18670 [Iodidimonas nitroreducens]
MSVDLEARIRAEGHDPKIYVTTPVFTGSVFFKACDVRALALWIGYDPLPDNPSHGEVWGSPRPNRFRRDQVSGLQQTAKWYVSLQDVEIR